MSIFTFHNLNYPTMRTEKDFLGEVQLPDDALYGINAWRASRNFANRSGFSIDWYMAVGLVKQACYQTALSFAQAASRKYPQMKLPAGCEDTKVLIRLDEAAAQVAKGKYFDDHFIVPAIQGGAGTAAHMNINEIITNVTLLSGGHRLGQYHVIDPFIHANIFQSTNDVMPTALRVAVMKQLYILETHINALRTEVEKHETGNRNSLRTAYTQMQQAVPSSFGLLFSAFSDALSRDWWRVSKCFERIKVTNLGGGATGTAMGIPRYYVMEVTNRLRQITGLPLTRSENHTDTTQNLDTLVEVHAILKAHAVNLEKIASDLQLLASDIMGRHEITLPQKQTGSSIMPGKVNPVISEFVISCAHIVYSNDMLISNLCGKGCLDLNAYLPIIGNALLDSLHLLISANQSMTLHLMKELQVNSKTAHENLLGSPAIATALLPAIGYVNASKLAATMKEEKINIYAANKKLGLLDEEALEKILLPGNLLKLGYSLGEE
jgi:aspartate ammonia-lyase